MPLTLALWCLAGLLAVSVLAVALHRSRLATPVVYGACGAFALILLIGALIRLFALPDEVARTTLPIGLPWIGARFRLDALSSFFLVIVDLAAAAASLYAIGYSAHEREPGRILPFFPAFLAGMNCVVMADDAFTFLVAWEFMSLASWALVLAEHREAENRQAAFVYIVMASFGTIALLMAFGLMAGGAGGYDFMSIAAAHRPAWLTGLAMVLVLIGAGSKAGLAPLHVWLPLAHPAAPSHVSALMSGAMTKVAIYGFIRVAFDLLGPPAVWWSAAIMGVGAATAILGVLFATIERDIKRLLAYSTIENIGIIFAALGLALAFKANGIAWAAAIAFVAALLHALNHALFKSILFFGAGAVLGATGLRDIEKLGGLIKRMPRSSFVMLGACMAISALPPLNGFVSEWLMFQAVLVSPILPQWGLKLMTPAVGAALALGAALCAAAFIRLYGIAYLGRPRSDAAAEAKETDPWSLSAMGVLLALCLLLGLAPGFAIDAIAPIARSLVGERMAEQASMPWLTIAPIAEGRSSYNGLLVFVFITVSTLAAVEIIHRYGSRVVRRGPAWDCGFPNADPATQYAASSFAQPIRRVFGNIVFAARETVDMPRPGEERAARITVEIQDRVWSNLFLPIASAVNRLATIINKLQFLTIRGYLSLVFAALIVLLVVVAAWR